MSDRLSVLLLTEGTYPYEDGGVSTWCDALCRSLEDVEFHLFAVTDRPEGGLRYEIPENVTEVRTLPLWSQTEPIRFFQPGRQFSDIYLRRSATDETAIRYGFIPRFRKLLECLFDSGEADESVNRILIALHRYFQEHDLERTFRSELTWNAFLRAVREWGEVPAPSLHEAGTSLKWMANSLRPLSATLPETDCTHVTTAGFCGLPGIVASSLFDTPMVVTDHRVYARERYLALSEEEFGPFKKRFLTRLCLFVTRQCYRVADQISPVCAYNRRWEEKLGADVEKIRTIHHGVRTDRFTPGPKPKDTKGRPTVVALAHVVPLKDIETMIRSCAVVRREIPEVRYRLYGSLEVDPSYARACRRLIAELDLENHFELCGYGTDSPRHYLEGDLTVLSSISEGFPYAALESMSCGRPVVATDVGGVEEAVGECGIVVPPGNEEALGREVVELLADDVRRARLGRRARRRVEANFRLSDCVGEYESTYRRLTGRSPRYEVSRVYERVRS